MKSATEIEDIATVNNESTNKNDAITQHLVILNRRGVGAADCHDFNTKLIFSRSKKLSHFHFSPSISRFSTTIIGVATAHFRRVFQVPTTNPDKYYYQTSYDLLERAEAYVSRGKFPLLRARCLG
jgi:hypothetical protein